MICLTSASMRIMSGASAPSRTRAGVAAAAMSASWSSRQAASTGASRALIIWLVIGGRLAGRRVAQGRQGGVALGLGCGGEDLGAADLGGGCFLCRVRDFPVWVIWRGGVGVQGIEGEVGAGVAEVVLLPPPRRQPPADLPGRQVGAGGQRVDLPGAAAAGGDPAGDLPQADRSVPCAARR